MYICTYVYIYIYIYVLCTQIVTSQPEDTPNSADVEAVAKHLESYAAQIKSWRDNLRTGATKELDSAVNSVLGKMTDIALKEQNAEQNLDKLEKLKKIAELVGASAAEASLIDEILDRRGQVSHDLVEQAVLSPLTTLEQVSGLLAAYRTSMNSGTLQGELQSHFWDARSLLIKFLTQESIKDNVTLSSCEKALQLAAHYVKDEVLQNATEQVAVVEKRDMEEATTITRQLLQFKDAVAARKALAPSEKLAAVDEKLRAIVSCHLGLSRYIQTGKHTGLSAGAQTWVDKVVSHFNHIMDAGGDAVNALIVKDARDIIAEKAKNLLDISKQLGPQAHGGQRGMPWHEAGWPADETDANVKAFLAQTLDVLDQRSIEAQGIKVLEACFNKFSRVVQSGVCVQRLAGICCYTVWPGSLTQLRLKHKSLVMSLCVCLHSLLGACRYTVWLGCGLAQISGACAQTLVYTA